MIICWGDTVGIRMAVWVTTWAPVIRLTYFIVLCGPHKQSGRSIVTDAMLTCPSRMCQEHSNLGLLLANATHANIHWIVIKALVNNNIIMQWQLKDSRLLILKVPYESLYNFLSNINNVWSSQKSDLQWPFLTVQACLQGNCFPEWCLISTKQK